MVAVRGRLPLLLLRVPVNIHEGALVLSKASATNVVMSGRVILVQVVQRCVLASSGCGGAHISVTETLGAATEAFSSVGPF